MRPVIPFLVGLFLTASLFGAEKTDRGLTSSTIMKSDIPADAPKFGDYPSSVYLGKNARLRFGSDADAITYKTQLRRWNREKVNFAGHYILATWGCGTECIQFMLIDAKTGKIYHPDSLSVIAGYNLQDEFYEADSILGGSGFLYFRKESELLILVGAPNEEEERRGISYYRWHGSRFELLKFIAKPSKNAR